MQEKVSITVPVEHTAAVRDDLVEEIADLADQLQGTLDEMRLLSEPLSEFPGNGGSLHFEACKAGDYLHLRDWAVRAKKDAEDVLKDLDGYRDPIRREHRARSVLAVTESVLKALAPFLQDHWKAGTSPRDRDVPIITLTRDQRDALVKQLDDQAARAIGGWESDMALLAAERQFIEDALELNADLESEQELYPLSTRLEAGLEVKSGWDGARRSVRLERLARTMLASAEEHLAKFPQGRPLPSWATGPLHSEETEEERAALHDEYRRDAQVEHEHQRKVRETCLAILEALGKEGGG